MCVVIGTLIQHVVSGMKDIVPAHEIVGRVTHSYSGSKYVEFKDVITNMLVSHKYENYALNCTFSIHLNERDELLKKKFEKQVSTCCSLLLFACLKFQ